jgi:hypothetical protein
MRAGDTIKTPGGRQLVVAWVDGEEVGLLCAPLEIWQAKELEVVHACDEATHQDMLAKCRREWQ